MCPILSLHLHHSQPITSGSNIGEAVRPVKAGMFSGSESHRGKSQEPRSLNCICGGNEADEAN
jgi:hypothetical protein